jgi:hypothetical protein
MQSRHTHFLKWTIAGLNTLTMHTEQSLFCGSIRLHIGTMDDNHGHTVAGIEVMTKCFTHIATVAEDNRPKRQFSGQIIDSSSVMLTGWAENKAYRDACTITNEMKLPAKIVFMFGIAFPVILRTAHFRTEMCTRTPID